MSALPLEQRLTSAEYLAREAAAETKSEYVSGRIYAMAGASYAHILLTGNAFREIANQLAESDCETYNSTMRVRIAATGSYVYPDVTVASGEKRFAHCHKVPFSPSETAPASEKPE